MRKGVCPRVQPALSPEEWADVEKYGCTFVRAENGPFTVVEEHQVAAVALYNQPFGFTREDVAVCRQHAELVPPAYPEAARLRSLADRIEALLPPNEEKK